MRKKFIFLALNLIFIGITFGQTKAEREKAISIVENLYYTESIGLQYSDKIEIKYNEDDERFEINRTVSFGEDRHIKSKFSFYLDDIDLTTMRYDYFKVRDDLYHAMVIVDAKGKSIELNSVDTTKKDKFPYYPLQESKYLDKLRLTVGKELPKRLMEKFVENIKIMLGAENCKKITMF